MQVDSEYARFREIRHFGSLDGLRCLSIVAVVWHHAAAGRFGEGFFGQGALGVNLFFVISGFLITTLLLRERARAGDISLRGFYLRRTLRIFPLYYLMLAVYVALVALLARGTPEGDAFFGNLPFFATYTSNWFVPMPRHGEPVFFLFAWSLATEEQFYLAWPSIERSSRRWIPVAIAIALIVVDQLVELGGLDRVLPPGTLGARALGSIATPICYGVLLAHLLHDPRGFALVRRMLGGRFAILATLAVTLALIALCPELGRAHESVVELGMALLVGSAVVREDHALAPVLRWAPLEHIGKVSYGIYLIHLLVLAVARRALERAGLADAFPLVFTLGLAGSVAMASASYAWFEGPLLALKDRLGRRSVRLGSPPGQASVARAPLTADVTARS